MMAKFASHWQGKVVGDVEQLDASQFWSEVETLSCHLQAMQVRCVALELDNSIAWLVVDFALMQAGIVALPLPSFFSAAQREHALQKAQPDLLISASNSSGTCAESWQIGAQTLVLKVLDVNADELPILPEQTQKITFTSGSTGQPKGVCLSAQQLLQVADSLVKRCDVMQPIHLCLLPLSVLLENVAGVYAPMLAGGTVHVPSLASLGFDGTALSEPQRLLAAITKVQPNTLILVPELLKGLVVACENGWQAPESLLFIAVGGAKVAPALLVRARKLGLPVYQGYGLSEAGSVVSLAPRQSCVQSTDAASVGHILDHVDYDILDGELVINSPRFLGYLGEPAGDHAGHATGDLVVNNNGEIHILGRKKNQLILSNGRNVSPEWPESLLLSHSAISQAVVVGEGEANLGALIYCAPQLHDAQLAALVAQSNEQLPSYARIANYVRLHTPLTVAQGYLSANQRPKRDAINRGFAAAISQLFQE